GHATVGGGGSNTAGGIFATVGGGEGNSVTGSWSAVAGGAGNTAGGYEAFAVGQDSSASGDGSFAAGTHAVADETGAFVWTDRSSGEDFHSNTFPCIRQVSGACDPAPTSGLNSFNLRATGGVRFVTAIDNLGN